MAEQWPFKPFVEGSTPPELTVTIQLLKCHVTLTMIVPPSQTFMLEHESLIVFRE